MPTYNEYMSTYMLRRYYARRASALAKLGGKCFNCGGTKDLELDHIDRTSKSFDIGKMWSVAEKRFWEEVGKCQLLCETCHIRKTILERGNKVAIGTHGTISSYVYCGPPKCIACKAAKRETHRRWRLRKAALTLVD